MGQRWTHSKALDRWSSPCVTSNDCSRWILQFVSCDRSSLRKAAPKYTHNLTTKFSFFLAAQLHSVTIVTLESIWLKAAHTTQSNSHNTCNSTQLHVTHATRPNTQLMFTNVYSTNNIKSSCWKYHFEIIQYYRVIALMVGRVLSTYAQIFGRFLSPSIY